jgi:soluble lytic murein transglycosylase-like protein
LTAYAVAKRAYQQYEEDKAAGRPNLSAKITLLYSYIKALDPGSVVREGEVQLTKTNQLFGDTLAIKDDLINKTGKAMSDTQMKSLMREMDILNQVNMSNWQSVSMDYTERAKGLNEFTVTHPYRVEDIIASPADPEVLAEFLGANTKNAAASQVRNAMRQWSMGNSSAINELIVPQEPAPDTAPAAGNASWLPTLSPEDTRSALSQVGVGQQTQPQQTPTTAPAATPPPTQYDGLIQQAAQKYNIHPALLSAVMQKESATRPDAVSPAGAIGLMQIMPDTGRDLGYTPEQLRDPAINIEAGAKYLKQLLDQFGGDAELALAAYNSGMGNVRKYGNKVPPFKETQDYVASLAPIAKTFGTNYIEQLAQRSGIPVFIEDGQ